MDKLPASPNEPAEKHFVGKVTVKAIVRDPFAKKILMLRAPNILWELPGGRLNEGETLEQALERELQEELGLVPHDYWKPYLLINEQCLHVATGSTMLSVTFVVPLKSAIEHYQDLGRVRYEPGVEAVWADEVQFRGLATNGFPNFTKETVYANCWNAVQAFWRSYRSA